VFNDTCVKYNDSDVYIEVASLPHEHRKSLH